MEEGFPGRESCWTAKGVIKDLICRHWGRAGRFRGQAARPRLVLQNGLLIGKGAMSILQA